jgi:hypothetical protein
MVPYYQFTHAVMPAMMVDSGDFAMERKSFDTHGVSPESMPDTSGDNSNKVVMDDAAVPIALAQAVPCPNPQNANVSGAAPLAPCDTESKHATSPLIHCSGLTQFSQGSIPPGNNVVLVPIPVPMSMESQCHQNMVDMSSPYLCHSGPYPKQFTMLQGSNGQWFLQETPNLAQPAYSNIASQW